MEIQKNKIINIDDIFSYGLTKYSDLGKKQGVWINPKLSTYFLTQINDTEYLINAYYIQKPYQLEIPFKEFNKNYLKSDD